MVILINDNEIAELMNSTAADYLANNTDTIIGILQGVINEKLALQMVQEMQNNPELQQTYREAVSAAIAQKNSGIRNEELIP